MTGKKTLSTFRAEEKTIMIIACIFLVKVFCKKTYIIFYFCRKPRKWAQVQYFKLVFIDYEFKAKRRSSNMFSAAVHQ